MGCGTSQFGQLGQTISASVPTMIGVKDIEHIFSGGWTSIFLNTGNTASFLGCNSSGQIPYAQTESVTILYSPQNMRKLKKCEIACGDMFTAILNDQGTIEFFGKFTAPENIKQIQFTSLFARFDWVAAIAKDGIYICKDEQKEAVKVVLQNEEKISLITSFTEAKVAILAESGNLYIYDGTNEKLLPLYDKIVSVASTRSRPIILKSDGRVYEVLGEKSILVTGYEGLPIALFAGGASLGLITFQGDGYMWGTGTHGQLGNGAFLNAAQPQKVLLEDRKIKSAVGGEEHTLFLTVKENHFAVLLPELMMNEDLPKAIVAAATIPYGFKPPEFDSKF